MSHLAPPLSRNHVRISRHFATIAFTLMEIIIAMSLVSVLMLLAWSLFQVYAKLEEKGSHLALEQQLARSLVRQVQTDLSRLVTPALTPTSGPSASGVSPLPGQVWLVGTGDNLEFLIRLPSDRWKQGSNRQSAPAMYQVISYHFTPRNDIFFGHNLPMPMKDESQPDNANATTNSKESRLKEIEVPPTGWLRESHWLFAPHDAEPHGVELRDMAEQDVMPAGQELAPSNRLEVGPDFASAESMDRDNPQERVRDERDEVGEVTRYRVRYFGQGGWVTEWDSRSTGLLPAAIEFVFELDTKPVIQEQAIQTREGSPDANDTEEALRQLPTNTGQGELSDRDAAFQNPDEFSDPLGDSLSPPSGLRGVEDERTRPSRYRTVVPLTTHVPDDETAENDDQELP